MIMVASPGGDLVHFRVSAHSSHVGSVGKTDSPNDSLFWNLSKNSSRIKCQI